MASTAPDAAAIHKEALASWETNAAYWDDGMGQDGNVYVKALSKPCLERLLANHVGPGRRVLELACGNGLITRWLVSLGTKVVATDGAAEMVAIAEKRMPEAGGDVEFGVLDATDAKAFEALRERTGGDFDAVVTNMALMDISSLDAIAGALPKLLKPGGVFVATLMHPVFQTSRARRFLEVMDDFGAPGRHVDRGIIIRQYMDVAPWKGWALPDQPALQYYFHRPLHELFGIFFKTGLVMDALEEPAFGEEHSAPKSESNLKYHQFPFIMGFRMRKL